MLANINYRGNFDVSNMRFPPGKPQQIIDRSGKYPLIFFKTGKCRIMGCKKPLDNYKLQYRINNIIIQSITVTMDMGHSINLYNMSKKCDCMFEPELFPALRLLKYNPICVNVFASGKVVMLGLRNLEYREFVDNVRNEIISLVDF